MPRSQTFHYYEYGELRSITHHDVGADVEEGGRVVGTRGYTQFNSSKPVPVTHYSNGGSSVHCGGPCGDLHVDEFGNT